MKQFIIFTKKEIFENIRNYKFIILLAVFILIGIMSPLIAKITPDILASIDLDGAVIKLPDPTALDSYSQFFKNFSQMGIVALIILFSGTIYRELNNNTAPMMFAKGLKKSNFFLAKYISSVILYTIGYVVAALITYGYTVFIFELNPSHLFMAMFSMYLFGIFLLSILKFTEVLTNSHYGPLLLTFGIIAVMFIGSLSPDLAKVSPLFLATSNMQLLTEAVEVNALFLPIISTVLISVCSIAIGINIFKRKEV